MGLVVEVEHPYFGTLLRPAAPVALSETPGRVAPGCMVGQQTESILRGLGYDDNRINGLAAAGVVRIPDELTPAQPPGG